VVSFGNGPAEVSDEIIAVIKSNIGDDGYVRFEEDLTEGDEVVISDGPLAGVTGIFQKRMKSSERVMLLLAAVNYQGRVVIDRALLEKSNSKPVLGERVARQGASR
jgi:transcription antitermination factor NusG